MLEGEHDIPTVLRMISYIHDRFSSYILEVSGKRCNGGNPTCADEVSKIVSDVLTHQVVRKKQKFLQSIQKQFGQSVMVKYMTQDKDMGDASQNQNATIDALKRSMIDALL
jgi:Na+-translocating ferredoxin:NAD+ oxidoreductase RNF subunit RnfB